MRAIWKGSIAFGLVTIPVRLYAATEERNVSFHQVRRTDGSRVKYKRIAAADGEEVAYADIAKGFELPSGETVILTDDDLADLPLSSSRAIEVESFVPLDQVDPIYFAKSYYLEPDGGGALKPYALLRQALADSGRVGIVKVALRQREQLATLRVREGCFVLETMLWPDEVRSPDFAFLDEQPEVRKQELAMASSLIDSLAEDFAPGDYTDAYREALQQLIDAKVEGHEVVAAPDAGDDGGGAAVLDLMSALRASVAAAKGGKPAAPTEVADPAPAADPVPAAEPASAKAPSTRPASKAPAAKAPAAKAPARKGAAAKAPGKKAPSAKTPAAAKKAAGRRSA